MTKRNLNKNQENVKTEQLTAVDFVTPHNHLPIPNALDFAKNDFFNHRIYVVAKVAYENGATESEVAKTLGVDAALIHKKYPKKNKCFKCYLRGQWEKHYKEIMDRRPRPNMEVQKLINQMRMEDQERLNCEHLEEDRARSYQ